jgi:antitoxin VapB
MVGRDLPSAVRLAASGWMEYAAPDGTDLFQSEGAGKTAPVTGLPPDPKTIYTFGVHHPFVPEEESMETAKLFWSGRSQAVRLPKAYRMEGNEVRIRRHGNAVILEPIEKDWAWLDEIAGPLDADFQAAASEKPEAEERPELAKLFE